MPISRRDLLLTSGAFLLGGTRAIGQDAPPPAQTQTRGPEAALLEALQRNRLPLTMSNRPAGRGWDWLLREARDARFTLIGEEHGVAETAQLSAGLFTALREFGYSRMGIELSPIIAQDIESAARRAGLQGILDLFAAHGTWSPMYLREEAEFIAAVIDAAPKGERALWGFDRELFSDRYLISRLEARVPRRARVSFARLKEASTGSWERREKDPAAGPPFLFAEDPALVSAVRAAWPNPDRDSDMILRTLEESLAINAVARSGTACFRRAPCAVDAEQRGRAAAGGAHQAEGDAEGRLQPHDPRVELRQHFRCRSNDGRGGGPQRGARVPHSRPAWSRFSSGCPRAWAELRLRLERRVRRVRSRRQAPHTRALERQCQRT